MKVWDVPTGLLVGNLHLPDDNLDGFALHPDGRRIVTGTGKGAVIVWDLATGEQLVRQTIDGSMYASSVAISPDGGRAVVGSMGAAVILDLKTGRILARLDTHGRPAKGVAFPPSGAVIATQSRVAIELWDVEKRRLRHTFRNTAQPGVVRFTPDGRHVIIGMHGNRAGGYALVKNGAYDIVVYDTDSGRRLHTLSGMKRSITDATISPDGSLLGVCGPDTLYVWSLKSESIVGKIKIYPRMSVSAAYSPDGQQIAIGSMPQNSRSPAVVTFDANTHAARRTFEGTRWIPTSAAFRADSRKVLIGSDNEALTLWDVDTGALTRTFTPDDDWRLMDVAIADDGKTAVAGSVAKVRLWNLEDGTQRAPHAGDLWIHDVDITPDGSRVAAAGYGGVVKVWDFRSGRLRMSIQEGGRFASHATSVSLTPDGRTVLWTLNGKHLRLSSVDNGSLLREFQTTGWIRQAILSRDGQWAVTNGDALTLWRLESPQPVRVITKQARNVAAMALSPDRSRLLTVDGTSTLTVREVETGAVVRELVAASGAFNNVAAAPDGRRAITSSNDGSARIWDLESGRSMVVVSARGEWLIYDDDGYFDASRRGGDLVALVHRLRPFRIDQLAVRYNRPGLLLRGMGLGRQGLWQHLYAQHRRRLRRLGLVAAELDRGFAGAPDVHILSLTPRESTAQVEFEVKPQRKPVTRYQIYANDVPLFGLAGRALPGQGGRFREEVALVPGQNRIEVSATDAHGIESFRELRTVESRAPQPRELHVLAFGVSHYANPDYDLGYAHKDALDLVEVLGRMRGQVFREVHANAFVDTQVTVERLRAAKQLLRGARPNDVLVVFVAGHGLYSQDDAAEYFYLTHEADISRLRETAAPFSLVEDLVQEVAPRHKLLLIDTCTSGDRDPEQLQPEVSAPGARGLVPRTVRALTLDAMRRADRQERGFLFERDRFIYNDLLRRSGAIVFSSSRGSELSFETEELQNGVFTKSILRALTSAVADADHDGVVTTDELRRHVTASVTEQTGGRQHPTVDHDNPSSRLGFPVVAAAASVLTRADPLARPTPVRARGLVLEADDAGPEPTRCVPKADRPAACGCRAPAASRAPTSFHGVGLLLLVALACRGRRRRVGQEAGPRSGGQESRQVAA